jgi:hypothetical protein
VLNVFMGTLRKTENGKRKRCVDSDRADAHAA